MDILVSLMGTIVVESGRYLCGSAYSTIKDMSKSRENINSLENEIAILNRIMNDIKQDIRMAEQEGKLQTSEVSSWLSRAEAIKLEVSILMANRDNPQGGCSNFCSRFRMSGEVAKKLGEVKEWTRDGFKGEIALASSRIRAVEELPGPSIKGQRNASECLKKVLDLLKDDTVRTVGVWGMGGVGKTTLIRNLNNELGSSSAGLPSFSVVVWVTVSKDSDIKTVQARIASRMNVKIEEWESIDDVAIRLFSRLKAEEKFLLILDDVWEGLDLEKIGVPLPIDVTKSKILLTSRSREVCREMKTDVDMKLNVLNAEEAWVLFVENAGVVTDQDHIKLIAKDVAKECGGLPLAIVTVGRAMRGKTRLELWTDALRVLQMSSSVPYIKGFEKGVFLPLKWSYDLLEGKNLKSCFLYCCLYPEDFAIYEDELIQCWIGEGLIDEKKSLDDAYNRGITHIETLKSSCLLESGNKRCTVVMHDIVRDLALWISNTSEIENKCLVRSGMGLRQILELETWDSLKRVSFMQNNISVLPESISQCSEVSTLFLQGNLSLKIPKGFFLGFRDLRVLNLSATPIYSSSLSFGELGGLRVLNLSRCVVLKELSFLRGLNRLEVLDLSHTLISGISTEITDLKHLRHLDLSYTHNLKSIRRHTLSGLSSLEVFDLRFSQCENSKIDLSPTRLMDRLKEVCCSLDNTEKMFPGTVPEKFFVHNGFVESELSIPYYKRTLFLSHITSIREVYSATTAYMLPFADSLVLQQWKGSFMTFVKLAARTELKNLQLLVADHCHTGTIMDCLIIELLENLRHVEISHCDKLMGLSSSGVINPRSKMKIMKLKHLPSLRFLFDIAMIWPSMEHIEVEDCPNLQSQPLSLKVPAADMNMRRITLYKSWNHHQISKIIWPQPAFGTEALWPGNEELAGID